MKKKLLFLVIAIFTFFTVGCKADGTAQVSNQAAETVSETVSTEITTDSSESVSETETTEITIDSTEAVSETKSTEITTAASESKIGHYLRRKI